MAHFEGNINVNKYTNIYPQFQKERKNPWPNYVSEAQLDCPWSGPGLVQPIFVDPGPSPQVQVQQTPDSDPSTAV